MLIPYVIERTGEHERSYDLYSMLLKSRIIMLGDEVNEQTANVVMAQMLFLEKEDPEADIHFYINSPGGSVYDGLAIYDVMQFVSCPVATTCFGKACSLKSNRFPPRTSLICRSGSTISIASG